MNGGDDQALLSLVRRLRGGLWRARFVDGMHLAAAASALLLLAAGVCQVWLFPVGIRFWLPLGLAPLLLGAAHALLWLRPTAAEAAALFDRQAGCDELLVSGWEACTTPRPQRSAGAAAVLLEVAAWARQVPVPRDWASAQVRRPWRSSYTAATWIILVIAAFLLQLPGRPAGTAAPVASAGTGAAAPRQNAPLAPGGTRAAGSDAASGRGEPGTVLEFAATEVPADAVPLHEKAAADNTGEAPGGMVQPPAESASAGAAHNLPGEATGSAAGSGAGSSSDAVAAQTTAAAGDPAPALPVNYADIARQIAGQVSATIAGAGNIAIGGAGLTVPSPAVGADATVDLRSLSMPYTTRFSSFQRLQINSYLEHLEALP